ncbi:hypothetical protein E4U55_006697 [Claviceps digitariae]|nr:hypothetical protein E4U55_006697 [Claviceps digitariae]
MSSPQHVSPMIPVPKQRLWQSRRSFVLYHMASLFISILFSLVVIASKASAAASFHFFHPQGGDSPRLRPGDYVEVGQISMYPAYLLDDYEEITLAGASISLVISVGMVLLVVFVVRRSKAVLLMKWQRCTLHLLLAGNVCLCTAIFVLNAVNYLRSARFDAAYTSPARGATGYGIGGQYDGGSFSIGSWACQMSGYSVFEEPREGLAAQCRDEAVALWGSLLMGLSNAVVVGLMWLDWRGERVFVRGFGSLWKENEEYYI